MVESPESKNTSEQSTVTNVVQLLEIAGYHYETRATHEDIEGNIHFYKGIGSDFYPHYHFIYKPISSNINVHIDVRRHKARRQSGVLSEELQRLYEQFKLQSQNLDGETARIAESLGRSVLNQLLFRVHEEISYLDEQKHTRLKRVTDKQKKSKLKKQSKHAHSEKKYKLKDETEETWYISDWEPIDPELHERVNRQLGQEIDKIE